MDTTIFITKNLQIYIVDNYKISFIIHIIHILYIYIPLDVTGI